MNESKIRNYDVQRCETCVEVLGNIWNMEIKVHLVFTLFYLAGKQRISADQRQMAD